VERELAGNSARSLELPMEWTVQPADDLTCALRIKRDGTLVPTPREERQAKEAERQAKEAAEARVKELEAELRRRDR
jgi:hypothetical protein